MHRTIFAATRTVDAKRPSVQALLGAVHAAAVSAGWPAWSPAAPQGDQPPSRGKLGDRERA